MADRFHFSVGGLGLSHIYRLRCQVKSSTCSGATHGTRVASIRDPNLLEHPDPNLLLPSSLGYFLESAGAAGARRSETSVQETIPPAF